MFPSCRFVALQVVLLSFMVLRGVLGQANEPTALATDGEPVGMGEEVVVGTSATYGPQVMEIPIGFYLARIDDLNIRDGNVTLEVYVWMLVPSPAIKPWETIQLINGRIEESRLLTLEERPDGVYVSMRMTAVASQDFQLRRFPLDEHLLVLRFEDSVSEDHILRFRPDLINSAVGMDAAVVGWEVGGLHLDQAPFRYVTNFGDYTLPTGSASSYSRVEVGVPIKRQGKWLLVRLFLGLAVSVIVGLIAHAIKATNVDPRFGLGVGALFTAVASQYIVASAVPEGSAGTTAEWLNLIGIGVILFSIVQSVVSLLLCETGREALARRLDYSSALILAVVFLFGSAAVVF